MLNIDYDRAWRMTCYQIIRLLEARRKHMEYRPTRAEHADHMDDIDIALGGL